MYLVLFLMIRQPPRSTLTDTLLPFTTLFRSVMVEQFIILHPFGAGEDIVPLGRLPVRLDQPCVQHRSGFQVFPRIGPGHRQARSEEHTSELQSLMRISYAVLRLQKKINTTTNSSSNTHIQTPHPISSLL